MFYCIFQLSAQLAASKESSLKFTPPPKEGVAAEGGAEDTKTVDELWEIIRYLQLAPLFMQRSYFVGFEYFIVCVHLISRGHVGGTKEWWPFICKIFLLFR